MLEKTRKALKDGAGLLKINARSLNKMHPIDRAMYDLKVLTSPRRLKILRIIGQNPGCTSTKIEFLLRPRENQSMIAQQLGILRRFSYVKRIQNGQYANWYINLGKILSAETAIQDLSGESVKISS